MDAWMAQNTIRNTQPWLAQFTSSYHRFAIIAILFNQQSFVNLSLEFLSSSPLLTQTNLFTPCALPFAQVKIKCPGNNGCTLPLCPQLLRLGTSPLKWQEFRFTRCNIFNGKPHLCASAQLVQCQVLDQSFGFGVVGFIHLLHEPKTLTAPRNCTEGPNAGILQLHGEAQALVPEAISSVVPSGSESPGLTRANGWLATIGDNNQAKIFFERPTRCGWSFSETYLTFRNLSFGQCSACKTIRTLDRFFGLNWFGLHGMTRHTAKRHTIPQIRNLYEYRQDELCGELCGM